MRYSGVAVLEFSSDWLGTCVASHLLKHLNPVVPSCLPKLLHILITPHAQPADIKNSAPLIDPDATSIPCYFSTRSAAKRRIAPPRGRTSSCTKGPCSTLWKMDLIIMSLMCGITVQNAILFICAPRLPIWLYKNHIGLQMYFGNLEFIRGTDLRLSDYWRALRDSNSRPPGSKPGTLSGYAKAAQFDFTQPLPPCPYRHGSILSSVWRPSTSKSTSL